MVRIVSLSSHTVQVKSSLIINFAARSKTAPLIENSVALVFEALRLSIMIIQSCILTDDHFLSLTLRQGVGVVLRKTPQFHPVIPRDSSRWTPLYHRHAGATIDWPRRQADPVRGVRLGDGRQMMMLPRSE